MTTKELLQAIHELINLPGFINPPGSIEPTLYIHSYRIAIKIHGDQLKLYWPALDRNSSPTTVPLADPNLADQIKDIINQATFNIGGHATHHHWFHLPRNRHRANPQPSPNCPSKTHPKTS